MLFMSSSRLALSNVDSVDAKAFVRSYRSYSISFRQPVPFNVTTSMPLPFPTGSG